MPTDATSHLAKLLREVAVERVVTVTLALPKVGLRALTPLYLADLGLPRELWEQISLGPGTPFVEGRLLRVEP